MRDTVRRLAAEASVCGEASVSTLYYPDAAIPAIERYAPSARLIVLLREPVDRAYSAFSYLRSKGFEGEESFLRAVEGEKLRRSGGWHHMWHYEAQGHYRRQLAPFVSHFGRDRLHISFFEDLVERPTIELRSIVSFLGVEHYDESDYLPEVNRSGTMRSNVVGDLARRTMASPIGRRGAGWVPLRVKEAVRRALLVRSGVDDGSRAVLAPRFAEDIAYVRDLAGSLPSQWRRSLSSC
jgi:hypothetical protein